ncbi:IS66 family insertion sequence element accessory protein TnpB [Escherichia coli]|uniref:IS66 family insertion sequence element accessory protein TnpB n=3 Tax=Escherichia coli TaxID=562 RepID=UPI0021E96ACC|nr:IS66 family insertion sequence element accessory protein TnpB [Escherichia coli]MCV3050099.1 IS66 family insertion sequence element accessory protein TnpB [Escherichia coli]MCV3062232.1 IS66 family insertion sequence element accessory protein TnpB [Escherichia coli]
MKKPMTDIKFIYHTKSPLTIYKQMHKGNVRLNIDVHGSPYKSGQGGLCVGDALYSPGMLHDWLKTVVDLQTIHCIRLVSCFSAYGGGSSFVCRLSRLLPEVYVKGYINEVFSKMSPQATGYALDKFGPVQTAVLLQRLFPDGPPPLDKFDKDFCSVTYKNGILIKRTDSKRK